MARNYKRKIGGRAMNTCDPERLKKAATAVSKGYSIRKASEKFGVKRSTLSDYLLRKHQSKQGEQTILSGSVECTMVERLQICANWGFPLTL